MSVMSMIVLVTFISIMGWVVTEIWGKNGKRGRGNRGDDERVRQLTQENGRLHEQLDAVHERLETLERIVTDKPSRLESEIDALKALSDRREKQE